VNLTDLTYLGLWNNQLSGEIPESIGLLTNLAVLNLWGNQISGEIPSSIGNLVNLTDLTLSNNELISGEIPPEIGNLVNLTGLSLSATELTGEIPPEIGNLVNLTDLSLGNNELSGEIPSEIGNLENLTYLSLYNNQLTGEIPTEIGNLVNLTSLELKGNELSREIPESIGSLINLTVLWLADNQLSGLIPSSIGNLVNLTELDLYDNQLSGVIPESICNIYLNLEPIYIFNNLLCPPYPECLTEDDVGTQDISECPEIYDCSDTGNAIEDCAGTCGGSAVLSGCDNVCNSTAVEDCAGVCGGSSVLSGCDNVCNSTAVEDCAGTCGGSAVEDCAGTCGGSAVLSGCDNVCNSTAVEDCAGVCGGTSIDTDGDGICDNLQGTVSDINGNSYKTIKIGSQNWMAENLMVRNYNNGDAIPTAISSATEWSNLSTGAYALYAPAPTCGDCYGKYYNWYAVDDNRGLCMEGWHVPTDDEWIILANYLAPDDWDSNYNNTIAGGMMKETGTEHWNSPNAGATNESGFTALPGGFRDNSGNYNSMGEAGYFWASTESLIDIGLYLVLDNSSTNAYIGGYSKQSGMSVRCLED